MSFFFFVDTFQFTLHRTTQHEQSLYPNFSYPLQDSFLNPVKYILKLNVLTSIELFFKIPIHQPS